MTRFSQRSRLGNKTISIDGNRIAIAGGTGRKSFESVFNLEEIDPSPGRRAVRFHSLIHIPLGFALFSAIALRIGLNLPSNLGLVFAPPIFVILVLSLWHAVKGFHPVEFVFYRNIRGEVIFDIVKDRSQEEEFEQFIEKLSAEIEIRRSRRSGLDR